MQLAVAGAFDDGALEYAGHPAGGGLTAQVVVSPGEFVARHVVTARSGDGPHDQTIVTDELGMPAAGNEPR